MVLSSSHAYISSILSFCDSAAEPVANLTITRLRSNFFPSSVPEPTRCSNSPSLMRCVAEIKGIASILGEGGLSMPELCLPSILREGFGAITKSRYERPDEKSTSILYFSCQIHYINVIIPSVRIDHVSCASGSPHNFCR